ncbi:hypothetical protein [Natronogracilivirga saccharolytica]|uniref:Long-chain fatty acid transport protein n=1 Tax=Natronogracilivirga saccharolytica TaxID=2812953 RepID=A0A8J7USG7_9BACT|nr:hypothetical protein [Natronogracilivirga saccharolytica]MBP3191526.1 hypothetical protein [Natronogracilivirga saccharolytica]
MQKLITTLALAAFLVVGLSASSESRDIWKGGSVYSHYGLGTPYDFRATYADGMGVYGVAMHDNRISSVANPASWSRAVFTNVSGVFEMKSHDATFGTEQVQSTQFQTGPFQMVMPIYRDRMGVSLSITPKTSSRYTTLNDYVLPASQNHSGSDLNYSIENQGSGGINKIEAGIGIRFTRHLSVGYAPSLFLGSINRTQTVSFEDADYRSSNLKESTSHYGFGNRFGLYYSRRDAFRQNDRAAFGLMVSLPVNFVSERSLETRVDFMDVDVRPASEYGDGDATYPLEASAGFSYNINPALQLSTDLLYQNWDNYSNFNGESDPNLQDRFRAGLGGQYIAPRRDGATMFSNFVYRLGVSYDTGNLKLNDSSIETFSIHAGIGIPSSRTNSSIDINAEYGFRGTDSDGLVSERVFGLKVSFNLSELMFIQRRLQ